MKFLIVFALAFATVWAKDLYSLSINDPVIENESRIAHGLRAHPGQFKYQVGIYLRVSSFIKAWCGGSLISENWILTAAHCTVNVTSGWVYLGATERLSAEQTYAVNKSDIITHQDWDSTFYKNDIALIRIKTTYSSSRIGTIRIPSNNDNKYLGDNVVVSGWGYIDDNTNELSNNLQYGKLKVSPGSYCSNDYGAHYSDDVCICAATLNSVSSCNGDYGGPLVLEGKDLQIGVISSGFTGCTKGGPTVFTRVSAYLPWIKSHTRI